MPYPDRNYCVVKLIYGPPKELALLSCSTTREKALAVLLGLTTDPFWDSYDRIIGSSEEDEDRDGFTACVRVNDGLLYAVPTRLLARFQQEHENAR